MLRKWLRPVGRNVTVISLSGLNLAICLGVRRGEGWWGDGDGEREEVEV